MRVVRVVGGFHGVMASMRRRVGSCAPSGDGRERPATVAIRWPMARPMPDRRRIALPAACRWLALVPARVRDAHRRDVTATTHRASHAGGRASARPGDAGLTIDPGAGIENIDHLVFIVQENRSFDHYFGTFPGADGIPTQRRRRRFDVCVPRSDSAVPCRRALPRHRARTTRAARTTTTASVIDVNGGRMDGFIEALAAWSAPAASEPAEACRVRPSYGPGGHARRHGLPHRPRRSRTTGRTREQYMLQDRMFAPTDSWTLARPPATWCRAGRRGARIRTTPTTCDERARQAGSAGRADKRGCERLPYAWADITWLLDQGGVSWALLRGPRTAASRRRATAARTRTQTNPLFRTRCPGFRRCAQNRPAGQGRSRTRTSSRPQRAGTLPRVSWVVPGRGRERAPRRRAGQHRDGPGMGHPASSTP